MDSNDYDLQTDPEKMIQHGTGAKRESKEGKGRYDLISPIALRRLAVVYEKGAVVHEPRNWEKGLPISETLSSAIRHIFQYLAGSRSEDHLAQSAWNLFSVMHLEVTMPILQDVPGQQTLLKMPKIKLTEELVEDMKTMPPGSIEKYEAGRRPIKKVLSKKPAKKKRRK